MMLIFTVITIVSAVLLFGYCEPTRKKLEGQLEDDCDFFDTKDINTTPGKIYGYNPLKKTIQIPDKETYKIHDFFALQHELGHMVDDKNNTVARWMKVIAFYRLIILPGSYIIGLINGITEAISARFVYIIIAILLCFVIVKLVFIFLYENSANNHALSVCEIYFEDEKMQIIKRFAKYNVMQQYLVTIAFAGLGVIWLFIAVW